MVIQSEDAYATEKGRKRRGQVWGLGVMTEKVVNTLLLLQLSNESLTHV